MALEKAVIVNLNNNKVIPVMFNPEEYSFDKSNAFAEIGLPGPYASPIHYVRGNVRTLKMKLFFDTFERKQDVREFTRRITGLMDTAPPEVKFPPQLVFSWGNFNFPCLLESVNQQFTMFLSDGTPVRATLDVSFKEIPEAQGSIAGDAISEDDQSNYLYQEDDTLSGIAAKYLNDSGAWRDIAKENGIDDPSKIPPGTVLKIPAKKQT